MPALATYPETIEADVSATRLARFFIKQDHGYQVVRELRETVIFTGHSLLSDAPYSRLDLISCRNVLIYLNPQAQHAVLSLFHFALTEGGVLFLGSSESVGDASEWFQPISKPHRLYRHAGRSRPGEVAFPPVTIDAVRAAPKDRAGQAPKSRMGIGEIAQRALIEAYAPASVLVNAKHEGLYFSGATDQYLKIVAGEDTRDVLAMARDGLRGNLRSALQRAKEGQVPVTLTGASMERHGGFGPRWHHRPPSSWRERRRRPVSRQFSR